MQRFANQTAKVVAAFCLSAAFVIGAGIATPKTTQAASCGSYGHVCTYRTVTKWVTQRVAYKKRVTLYKPCGTPYYAWKTYYKNVRVPVTYRVKVCH